MSSVYSRGLEAILLTGGASRRMGSDKACLLLEEGPLGERIAKRLATRAQPVTVLGRQPIAGFEFLQDSTDYSGPLSALSRFTPTCEYVFIASCDLVRFEAEIVDELLVRVGTKDAALPVLNGREQPLCALYRSSALGELRQLVVAQETRMMAWISRLGVVRIDAADLPHGIACTNVNTRAEFESAMIDDQQSH
jgi:molybdopterin-guanine dinucleotide biosynthesis protein A